MTCDQRADEAERYVTNQLTEGERSAFEDHFFECATCLARVQNLQLLQEALAADSGALSDRSTRVGSRVIYGAGLAAAAAVVLAVLVWHSDRLGGPSTTRPAAAGRALAAGPVSPGTPPPAVPGAAESTLTLAIVTPPRYTALTVRSDRSSDAKAFDAAMKRYSAGQYDAAARALRPLVRPSLDLPHAAFFLGISELMGGHLEAARNALDRTAKSGVFPYADEAHFYLAKIDLRTGDVEGATRELEVATRLEAGPPGEAQRLLTALRSRRR